MSPCSWTSLPPPPYPIPLGCYRALDWTWVKQQLCTSYLFYMWWCVYFNTPLSFVSPSPPTMSTVCSLYLHLYSCPENMFISTIFFFFLVISLCITGSKFIHLSTTDSNLFLFVTSLLMKVKEESEKGGLKFNIQKNKIMPSVSITSWQIDGETIKTVTDFIFLSS